MDMWADNSTRNLSKLEKAHAKGKKFKLKSTRYLGDREEGSLIGPKRHDVEK